MNTLKPIDFYLTNFLDFFKQIFSIVYIIDKHKKKILINFFLFLFEFIMPKYTLFEIFKIY